MEKALNSFTLSVLPDQPSSKSSSFSATTTNNGCISPVVQLQSKFFPIQPRGGNLSGRDIRYAEILPAMSMDSNSGSSSSSTTSSTIPLGKLKEPRDLYSTATLQHPIKWPVECQVIPEKIRHIDSPPHKLEPYYSPTLKEPQPQPVGIEMGTVVYDYQPKLSVDYFCRATVGGSQDFDEYDTVHNNSEPSALRFESRFESGNLAKAIKVTNMYYELYLRPDLYTERHAQWFYFRIQNTKDNVQYRFSIVNFNKPDSLYRYGLKILMYSEKEAQLNQVGWTRCGQNITYFKNDISPDENGPYYTLTFNLKFKHNNDTVYLAQCYPYTYSTLQNYLKSIEDDEFKSQLLTIRLLCRSLAGNNVHVLTVTSPDSQQPLVPSTVLNAQPKASSISGVTPTTNADEEPAIPNANKKPVIVISARVHPGETQSSYMMKGIIDFLTSDCSQAKELRDRFIFKLIPMLNPDGVIVGNTRCCLLGQDLNRQYRTVLREAFPQIYHAKVMLRRLQEENGISLYCDLHGHSRRHNVFIYGCENRRVPERKLVEQVFPLMMHKNAADKFSFQNCKFKIQKNKEGTGRIFVWTLGVVNSYTLEISLGGSTMPSRQYTHFNTSDYEACGRHFCESLLDYSDPTPMKENLRDRILQKLVDEGSTADEPKNVVLSDYSSLSNSETDGEDGEDREDSSPEADTANSSLVKSLTSSGISSASLTLSNSNTTAAPSKQLKRQVSLRKHHYHHHHPPPSQSRLKSAGRGAIKLSGESTRSPLPIHRASVDFTKIKQRKLDENFVLQAAAPPPSPSKVEDDSENLTSSSRDVSAVYRRLSKFRRKSRKHHGSFQYASSTENTDHHLRHYTAQQQYHLTAKCTRIIFDDPFNPPGAPLQKPYPHRRSSRYAADCMEAFDLNSGTEDECDPYDNMSGVKGFSDASAPPTIKITDCGGDPFSSNSANDELRCLAGEMARLEVSGTRQQKSSSDSESQSTYQAFPQFAPFVPSFPVGKAYLRQTFYPEKPTSSPRGGEGGNLKNSLSDTTIATSAVDGTPPTSASNSGNFKQAAGISTARRSSISYMGGCGTLKGRLQATGTTTMLGAREPTPSSRRRVSWTGTLTVSIPTVTPNPVILKSPTNQNPNRKSFRKSKSLNDKPSHHTSQQRQSSTEMTDSAGSLVASTSLDKIASSGGSVMKGKFGGLPGHSQSVGSLFTGVPSTSSTKKRKGKLKRSKNK